MRYYFRQIYALSDIRLYIFYKHKYSSLETETGD